MQTIFSGHTQGRLTELIAPKKYLHGFGTAIVSVRELIVQKRCLHRFVSVALLALVFIFAQNACVSEASAASMTLTVPAAISLDVQPTGTLAKSSASSFSAKTDGAWGYNLSIKAKSTTDMVDGSAKLAAISKNMTESEYQAAGNNNTWGFMPSRLNNNANSNFVPAATSGATIEKTSVANASAATNYSITLGAKADNTLVKGTYSNTMVLTLSANTVNYNITYNCNSGTSCPSPQTGTTANNSVNLSDAAPNREGYEFRGWCSVATSNESCSGQTIQPGKPITLSNGNNNITLYAMWGETGCKIIYSNLEGASDIPNTNPQECAESGKTYLSSNTPKKEGYIFLGWCTSITQNNKCDGNMYQPSSLIITSSQNIPMRIYAVWGKPEGNIENWSGCNNLEQHESIALKDSSGKEYVAIKLHDNACWITRGLQYFSRPGMPSCPTGWSLPSYTQLKSLYQYYKDYNGMLFDLGLNGFYWSSTTYPYSYEGSTAYNCDTIQVYSTGIRDYGTYTCGGGTNVTCIRR